VQLPWVGRTVGMAVGANEGANVDGKQLPLSHLLL
jgi:hypothetical protein